MRKAYRIISIEAADIYRHEQENGVSVGYKMPENKSDDYFRLFKIYLDNSLDSVELENAYKRVYRKKFSFQDKYKRDYTLAVINLKFNYTYKSQEGKPVKIKDLRSHFYQNRFYLDGVHYVRYKRSAGSSREGKCLFIDERLYKAMDKWSSCGLKVQTDLASWESYKALSLSSIKGTVQIPLDGILFVPDYKSIFTEEVVSVELKDGKLVAEQKQTEIINDIWDGESLLDESVFENGYTDNFTNPVTVEKFGGKYYMTFGFSSSIGYLNLNLDGKEVGKTSEKKDGWTYVTYTLSENNLKSKLSFSAYINAMSREMSFSATLNLSLSEKTSDTVRNLGERPAEFVPVISTKAAAEYSLKVGTVFPIPEASATLGNEDSLVVITAVFGNEPIDVSGGKLTLGNVGEYKIIYKATNSRYKTSLGNDSFSEYVVTVHAVTGENDIVKFRDTNQVLPEKAGILAGKVTEGSGVYEKAASAMKKIADNFEVYSAEFLSEDGEVITLSGKVELLFRADDYFDRTKAEVYYMDENGELTRLSASGYGRYVATETDKTGTFIVCIPGVAFRMPMWGYALILAGAVVVLAGIVVTIIVVTKRKKRMKNS